MTMSELTAPVTPNTRLFGAVDRQVNPEKLVIPGLPVSQTGGFMRGHGTYMVGETLFASTAGTVKQVNRLVNVQCVKQRYAAEVGDVVVGYVVEVQEKKWRVDISSRQDANLPLTSVNLPGGEQRRKTAEDELAMREYLMEGDLISAEVQMVRHDGAVDLHTRNLKYGKLGLGIAVRVPSYLVKRRKSHFHSLPCGAGLIIGCNGLIWICERLSENADGGYNVDLTAQTPEQTMQVLSRLHNCIRLLSDHGISIFETSVINCFDISLHYDAKDLLKSDIAAEVAEQVIAQLRAAVEE